MTKRRRLQKKLNRMTLHYELTDPEIVKVSQELDPFMVQKQKALNKLALASAQVSIQ